MSEDIKSQLIWAVTVIITVLIVSGAVVIATLFN